MFTGTPLSERVKRLVEKQMTILESWASGEEGLTIEQLDQLKTLAMIARQMDLDGLPSEQPPRVKELAAASTEELLAQIPSKK